MTGDDELMLVTVRGIVIRQAMKAISSQSRAATGVRVQRLDEDDAIAAVAVVPASETPEDEDIENAENAEIIEVSENAVDDNAEVGDELA